MSKQLYKYISTLLVDYFKSQMLFSGERFNLYLENEEHVKGLYQELSETWISSEEFIYKHPEGDGTEYKTYYLKLGEIKLIIASSENASEDYFTMLRNQVAEQKGVFKNTAILILFSGKLDSLIGGSGSLIKEGMPLHYKAFKQRLLHDIENLNELKKFEKITLKEVLEQKTKSVVEDNNSIFDYEQIITTLVNKTIKDEDYQSLGLFKNEELSSKTETGNIKKSLKENFELFERLENIHLHGNPEVDLEKIVSETGKQKLSKGNWNEYDFSEIVKWKRDKQERKAPVFIEAIGSNIFNTIWSKADGDTTSAKRNNNIVIFNPNNEFPFEIELKFDQSTRREGINLVKGKKENLSVSSSGHSLKVEISALDNSDPISVVHYKDDSTNKTYKFKILILPVVETFLKNFDTNFTISNNIKYPQLLLNDSNELIFNSGIGSTIEEQLEVNKNYEIDQESEFKINIDYALISDDLTPFEVTVNEVTIPVAIKTESEPPKPIIGLDVWKDKRQFEANFRYTYEEDVFKLQFKNNERTVRSEFRKNLLLEKQIIESDSFFWIEKSDNELGSGSLEISDGLKNSFNALRNFYKEKGSLPSLVFLKGQVKKLAEDYIEAFLRELNSIKENKPVNKSERDLIWLGVIKEQFNEGLIKYSPLHPLNIVYQLSLNEQIGKEEVYSAILKRLNSANLVPFIENDKKVYMPVDSDDSPEWTYYTEYLQSEKSVPQNFIKKLITSKLEGFTHNFDFLFSQSNYSPIILNVINLGDCNEVVQGIFEYYRVYLNKNTTKRPVNLHPIEINIYGSENLVTKFEELTYYDKVEDVEDKLNVKLKTNNFEKEDLLNVFLEKVNFYRKPFPKDSEEYEYAHITFYQFDRNQIERNTNKVDYVKSGLSMNGLISDVSSSPMNDTYRTGFGTANMPNNETNLSKLVCLYNALVNVATSGENFELDKAICSTINFSIKEHLDKLYTNSQWVTFIDPKVDLDFFKEKDDLVIIHYSDQYNNSSGYDAITVSNKTEQYANIVGEFLTKNKVQFDSKKDTLSVINFFNAINGDWLLKLIRQDNQFPREKISILSGIKTALTFLYHPNIIWIPVSLEEILRISGSAGLKMSEGLFSAKNLGSKEFSFSDDLLMIGLEKVDDSLQMYLYPIELKIGGTNLIITGIGQGKRTVDLLRKHLQSGDFLGEFYKNFFGKLSITNAEKMNLYKIWRNQKWDTVFEEYRSDLMNNNFDFSTNLDSRCGEFGLIHFGNSTIQRELTLSSDYLTAKLLEEDGYNFLVKSIDELIELFHNTQTGIDKDNLLSNKEVQLPIEKTVIDTPELSREEIEVIDDFLLELPKQEIKPQSVSSNKGIEILFGSKIKDGSEVIWEPNNTDKVMHTNTGIIGTMGTGKTQFTKSLISQLLSHQDKNIGPDKLGILIFDYKGDYIKEDFVNATSAKVYAPFHLPYNPLALDATEKSKPMLPLHTANNIKETISNAFNLGNVQKQKLKDAIIDAYEAKGIHKGRRSSWTLLPPTISDVCDIYMQDEKVAQDSLYAAISNLQDFEIFESDASKTKSLYDLVEGVTVINLSGYDESIQNLIVAITLDAFYTQMQTHGHSIIEDGKRQIKKMILVDEADNFLSKNFNSIKKILKEGREFGVGTVLSTQFLNHFSTSENDYSNYILTWVIHRVTEIKTKEVESLFSIESKDQRDSLIKTIKGLEKHQSIVNLAGSPPILIKDKAFWELISG